MRPTKSLAMKYGQITADGCLHTDLVEMRRAMTLDLLQKGELLQSRAEPENHVEVH